jgi:hypothetical protein
MIITDNRTSQGNKTFIHFSSPTHNDIHIMKTAVPDLFPVIVNWEIVILRNLEDRLLLFSSESGIFLCTKTRILPKHNPIHLLHLSLL